MLHGTVSCFTSLLSSFLPSFWLDLLQVSRHSCVFELLGSFPLGCCCQPLQPAGCPSRRMPRPLFILIESRPLYVTPPSVTAYIYRNDIETRLLASLCASLVESCPSTGRECVPYSWWVLSWGGCGPVTEKPEFLRKRT